MSKFRPFTPPANPVHAASATAAPPFPAAGAPVAKAAPASRAFVPPPLHAGQPTVDLQAMLDAAQQEVDALHAKAQSQTRALEDEKSKVHGSLSVLEDARGRACRVLARDAVMLGIEIARSLAGRAFEVDQSHLLSLVRACLEEFSAEHAVVVRVAASDAASVRAQVESEALTTVEVRADPTLSPGDLAVEAEQLVIDARVCERLATLREELAATVRADQALEDASESEVPAEDETP